MTVVIPKRTNKRFFLCCFDALHKKMTIFAPLKKIKKNILKNDQDNFS